MSKSVPKAPAESVAVHDALLCLFAQAEGDNQKDNSKERQGSPP